MNTSTITLTFRRVAAALALCVAFVTASAAISSPAAFAEPAKPPAAAKAKAKAKGSSGKRLVGKLNLNKASAEELVMLPGIGKTKAERIVAWRAKHGKFRRVVDLRRVKGFGKKSVAKLEPYLTTDGASTLRHE